MLKSVFVIGILQVHLQMRLFSPYISLDTCAGTIAAAVVIPVITVIVAVLVVIAVVVGCCRSKCTHSYRGMYLWHEANGPCPQTTPSFLYAEEVLRVAWG